MGLCLSFGHCPFSCETIDPPYPGAPPQTPVPPMRGASRHSGLQFVGVLFHVPRGRSPPFRVPSIRSSSADSLSPARNSPPHSFVFCLNNLGLLFQALDALQSQPQQHPLFSPLFLWFAPSFPRPVAGFFVCRRGCRRMGVCLCGCFLFLRRSSFHSFFSLKPCSSSCQAPVGQAHRFSMGLTMPSRVSPFGLPSFAPGISSFHVSETFARL